MPEEIVVRGGKLTVPLAGILVGAVGWMTWMSVQIVEMRENIAGLKATVRQTHGIVRNP